MATCKDKPRGESEADIQQAIRLALGLEPDLVLLRNNIGAAVHHDSGRPVQYGVGGKGGSDLIGFLTVPVTLANGRQTKMARWIALEVKKPGGRVSAEQWGFIEMNRHGYAFAAIVYSVEDARAAIQRAREGDVG